MRRQFRPTVERLFVRPVRDLADTTFLLITNPASVAREYARQDGDQFTRAVTYFVAAFSAAVVLSKVVQFVLGIETIKEVQYWSLHVAMVLCIALLAALLAFAMQSAPVSLFLKMAFLAFGASFLIGNFMLAGASLTLFGLREVGYIPDFNVDMTLVRNYEKIGELAYWECLSQQSILFDALYHGFAAGNFKALRAPLDELYYLEGIFLLAASVLFTILAYFGSERRRWASGLAAGLSSALIIAGIEIGDNALGHHLRQTTPCEKQFVEDMFNRTAEDIVRAIAENHAKDIGKRWGNLIVTGVDQDERSLILRFRVSERDANPEEFAQMMKGLRQRAIHDYCTLEHSARLRKAGVSQVWMIQYANTELVERIVQSEDQCRR